MRVFISLVSASENRTRHLNFKRRKKRESFFLGGMEQIALSLCALLCFATAATCCLVSRSTQRGAREQTGNGRANKDSAMVFRPGKSGISLAVLLATISSCSGNEIARTCQQLKDRVTPSGRGGPSLITTTLGEGEALSCLEGVSEPGTVGWCMPCPCVCDSN